MSAQNGAKSAAETRIRNHSHRRQHNGGHEAPPPPQLPTAEPCLCNLWPSGDLGNGRCRVCRDTGRSQRPETKATKGRCTNKSWASGLWNSGPVGSHVSPGRCEIHSCADVRPLLMGILTCCRAERERETVGDRLCLPTMPSSLCERNSHLCPGGHGPCKRASYSRVMVHASLHLET